MALSPQILRQDTDKRKPGRDSLQPNKAFVIKKEGATDRPFVLTQTESQDRAIVPRDLVRAFASQHRSHGLPKDI